MKNLFSARKVICAILLLSLLCVSCLPAASADTGKEYLVTLDIDLASNIFMARYGVTVCVDDMQLQSLPQGGRTVKILSLKPGIHTVRLAAMKQGIPETSFDIYVGSNMTIASSLQTHRKSVGITSLTLTLPSGVIRYRDVEDSWAEFVVLLLEATMKYAG